MWLSFDTASSRLSSITNCPSFINMLIACARSISRVSRSLFDKLRTIFLSTGRPARPVRIGCLNFEADGMRRITIAVRWALSGVMVAAMNGYCEFCTVACCLVTYMTLPSSP